MSFGLVFPRLQKLIHPHDLFLASSGLAVCFVQLLFISFLPLPISSVLSVNLFQLRVGMAFPMSISTKLLLIFSIVLIDL